MKKFLAVVKREYVQRVRTKFFIVATVLGPAMMILVTVVPALMFTINAGGPTRLAACSSCRSTMRSKARSSGWKRLCR